MKRKLGISGDSINVNWHDAPGTRNDYIALYHIDKWQDIEAQLTYVYIGARPSGTLDLSAVGLSGGYTIGPSTYRVRLMKDDGYEVLAESGPFEILQFAIADRH